MGTGSPVPSARGAEQLQPPGLEGLGGEGVTDVLAGVGVS